MDDESVLIPQVLLPAQYFAPPALDRETAAYMRLMSVPRLNVT